MQFLWIVHIKWNIYRTETFYSYFHTSILLQYRLPSSNNRLSLKTCNTVIIISATPPLLLVSHNAKIKNIVLWNLQLSI